MIQTIIIIIALLTFEAIAFMAWHQSDVWIRKQNQKTIDGLWQENKELKEALFKRVAGTTIPEAKEAIEEATVTKEPEEVSEDIYNLTLEQWIYGAKEDKEGGIDG